MNFHIKDVLLIISLCLGVFYVSATLVAVIIGLIEWSWIVFYDVLAGYYVILTSAIVTAAAATIFVLLIVRFFILR